MRILAERFSAPNSERRKAKWLEENESKRMGLPNLLKEMKPIFTLLITIACFQCGASELSDNQVNRIVDAIGRVENSKRFPYGIKSVQTNNPRRVCENTVRRNHARWIKAGSPGSYLDFLAGKYCPNKTDPKGFRNWRKNIHKILK